MGMNKPITFITVLSLLLFVFLGQAQPPLPVSPVDLDACKNIVSEYCSKWKETKYNDMYALLSPQGMGQMPRAKFINTYGIAADNGGKLSNYTTQEALPNQDGVMVKIELTFIKEVSPNLINGIHNFHLVKDSNSWKIKAIVAPIAPPPAESGHGGSHPGK